MDQSDYLPSTRTLRSAAACHVCGLEIPEGADVPWSRESVGFGQANDRRRVFCSVECSASFRGVSVATEETRQARLYEWGRGRPYRTTAWEREHGYAEREPTGQFRQEDTDDAQEDGQERERIRV